MLVRRNVDNKELFKQRIVYRLEKQKRQLYSDLLRYFSKGSYKMSNKTLIKYLRELIREKKVEKVGAFYILTEFGEDYWWRNLISQKLEEFNRTDLDHIFLFQDFLSKNKDTIDAIRFSALFQLFQDLVKHEDLFDVLKDLKFQYNVSLMKQPGGVSPSWYEFLCFLLESKKSDVS